MVCLFVCLSAGLTTSLSLVCSISIVPSSEPIIKGHVASHSWKATDRKFGPTSKWECTRCSHRDTGPGRRCSSYNFKSKSHYQPAPPAVSFQLSFLVRSVIILWIAYLYWIVLLCIESIKIKALIISPFLAFLFFFFIHHKPWPKLLSTAERSFPANLG